MLENGGAGVAALNEEVGMAPMPGWPIGVASACRPRRRNKAHGEFQRLRNTCRNVPQHGNKNAPASPRLRPYHRSY
jgi:hypothetical protein